MFGYKSKFWKTRESFFFIEKKKKGYVTSDRTLLQCYPPVLSRLFLHYGPLCIPVEMSAITPCDSAAQKGLWHFYRQTVPTQKGWMLLWGKIDYKQTPHISVPLLVLPLTLFFTQVISLFTKVSAVAFMLWRPHSQL